MAGPAADHRGHQRLRHGHRQAGPAVRRPLQHARQPGSLLPGGGPGRPRRPAVPLPAAVQLPGPLHPGILHRERLPVAGDRGRGVRVPAPARTTTRSRSRWKNSRSAGAVDRHGRRGGLRTAAGEVRGPGTAGLAREPGLGAASTATCPRWSTCCPRRPRSSARCCGTSKQEVGELRHERVYFYPEKIGGAGGAGPRGRAAGPARTEPAAGLRLRARVPRPGDPHADPRPAVRSCWTSTSTNWRTPPAGGIRKAGTGHPLRQEPAAAGSWRSWSTSAIRTASRAASATAAQRAAAATATGRNRRRRLSHRAPPAPAARQRGTPSPRGSRRGCRTGRRRGPADRRPDGAQRRRPDPRAVRQERHRPDARAGRSRPRWPSSSWSS